MLVEDDIGIDEDAQPPAPEPAREQTPPRRLTGVQFRLFLHTLWESFRIAVASLRANKLRTGLTLIGIVVGVA
ncbi:MAG TPA: hypothetical protein VM943_13220, partial [Pyrinomonadaceae bacterium]|nr:hypothetical protein [Pyrinomonadaceae bacterium]